MASGIINLDSTKRTMEGRIEWESSSNGAEKNTSNVTARLQVRRNDGYTTKGTWTGNLQIDNQISNNLNWLYISLTNSSSIGFPSIPTFLVNSDKCFPLFELPRAYFSSSDKTLPYIGLLEPDISLFLAFSFIPS